MIMQGRPQECAGMQREEGMCAFLFKMHIYLIMTVSEKEEIRLFSHEMKLETVQWESI